MDEEDPGFYTRPSAKEREDIYYVESEDIDLLESLLEEVEGEWESYAGTFEEFSHNVWYPRMCELCSAPSESDEERIQRIRGLGVVLETTAGDSES